MLDRLDMSLKAVQEEDSCHNVLFPVYIICAHTYVHITVVYNNV